jgi:hypothetical protein
LLIYSKQGFVFPAAADGLGSIAIDTTQLNMSVTDPTAWATAMNNLGMVPVGLPGQQLVSGKLSPGLEDAHSGAKGVGDRCPVISAWWVLNMVFD